MSIGKLNKCNIQSQNSSFKYTLMDIEKIAEMNKEYKYKIVN